MTKTFWCVFTVHSVDLFACRVGDKCLASAQEPADAANAAMRQKQPVSEMAVDVQVRLHIQLGETDQHYRMMMSLCQCT